MTEQYHDMGLEHLFMEPDDPYEVSFKSLFKNKGRLSMTEMMILVKESERQRAKELQRGLLMFHTLLKGVVPSEAPHLAPLFQIVLGPLTSKEFKTITLIILEKYSESQVAAELNITRRTVRTYKKRALEKIFKNLPKQETTADNATWSSPIKLPLIN